MTTTDVLPADSQSASLPQLVSHVTRLAATARPALLLGFYLLPSQPGLSPHMLCSLSGTPIPTSLIACSPATSRSLPKRSLMTEVFPHLFQNGLLPTTPGFPVYGLSPLTNWNVSPARTGVCPLCLLLHSQEGHVDTRQTLSEHLLHEWINKKNKL